jgi:hypothetical protein
VIEVVRVSNWTELHERLFDGSWNEADEGSNVFTGEMLGHVAGDLAALDGLADEPFLLFFEPPSLDDRIVNQHALFSLISHPATRLDDWLDAHPALGRKIVVPADLKWELRDKLDQVNVTERVLFPGSTASAAG